MTARKFEREITLLLKQYKTVIHNEVIKKSISTKLNDLGEKEFSRSDIYFDYKPKNVLQLGKFQIVSEKNFKCHTLKYQRSNSKAKCMKLLKNNRVNILS